MYIYIIYQMSPTCFGAYCTIHTLCFVADVTTSQKADSFQQVRRVLPDDCAVCAETWRDLINNIYTYIHTHTYIYIYIYIYSTVCAHLVGILKI
jgi:hypothetical protein